MIRLAAPAMVLIGGVALRAQNLVPNPGFESYRKCPTADFQFDGYVEDWKSATVGGSPDYFNACNTDSCSQSTPGARYGRQTPRDSARGGRAYAGIYCTNIGVNYREYCKTRLVATLEKDRWYRVAFFASLAGASPVGVMNLGAYLGADSAVATSYVYPASPQILYPKFLTRCDGWTEISGLYRARGDERYLVIGCFDRKLLTTPSNAPGACAAVKNGGAYYYIDDASITPIEPPSCSSGADYYDVEFKPAGSSADECCWDVVLSSKATACPLYGVSAFLPSGTTPFTWTTDSPVLPGETRTVGRFCLGADMEKRDIFAAYLDEDGAPMSGATRELRCGAPIDALAARAETFAGGSADFCAYDLYIDNSGDVGIPLEALALAITGGEFQEMSGADWTPDEGMAPGAIGWHAAGGIIAPHSSAHIGRFSVDAAAARPSLTVSLRQHAADRGAPDGVDSLALACTTRLTIGDIAGSPRDREGSTATAAIEIAPNPARGETTIAYRLERDGPIWMELFDMSGTMVARITDGYRARGEHTLRWDARGLANGVYRLRLRSEGAAALATLIVAR